MMSPDALLSYPLWTWQERCCAEVGKPSAGFAYLDRMSEVEEDIWAVVGKQPSLYLCFTFSGDLISQRTGNLTLIFKSWNLHKRYSS